MTMKLMGIFHESVGTVLAMTAAALGMIFGTITTQGVTDILVYGSLSAFVGIIVSVPTAYFIRRWLKRKFNHK